MHVYSRGVAANPTTTTTTTTRTTFVAIGDPFPGPKTKCNCFVELDYTDVNLALNKPASESSTYNTAVASGAVDGLEATGSCTNADMHPWLSIDLQAEYDVGHVTVRNDDNAPYGNYRRTCYCIH